MNDYNTTATYDTRIELIKGQSYGIRVVTPWEAGSHLRIWLASSHNYEGGVLLKNEILGLEERLYGDLFFKVMVTPVPEPSLQVLVILGLSSCALLRRRHLHTRG